MFLSRLLSAKTPTTRRAHVAPVVAAAPTAATAAATTTTTASSSPLLVLPVSAQRRLFAAVSSSAPSTGLAAASTGRHPHRHHRALAPHVGRRGMFIQVQDTPNPDSLKFYPGVAVLDKGTFDVPSFQQAGRSPLARRLFQVDGVKSVFLATDFVTVNKHEDHEWGTLKPHIFAALMAFFSTDQPVLNAEDEATAAAAAASDTAILPGDSEEVAMIKEILETRVRPAVQEDGGDILYAGFREGVVFLKMQGSCSGCPSSSATLKGGIERMLMHYVPGVMGVVAVTDAELERINADAFAKTEKQIADAKSGGGGGEASAPAAA